MFIIFGHMPIMSNELKVVKLSVNGHNWITYHDWITTTLTMKFLTQCIDNDIIPQSYTDAGDVGGITHNEWWVVDQATTKNLIVSLIPDSIFNQIKDHVTMKGIWDAMKALFEGWLQNLIIDLQQKL